MTEIFIKSGYSNALNSVALRLSMSVNELRSTLLPLDLDFPQRICEIKKNVPRLPQERILKKFKASTHPPQSAKSRKAKVKQALKEPSWKNF